MDKDGYLNLGRQTGKAERNIDYACKDFRLPSKIFKALQIAYSSQVTFDFEIYKDKYWQTMERFRP